MITDKSGIADNLIISILTAFLCLHSCEKHVDLPQIKHRKHCNSNSTPSAIFQGRAIWPWTPSHLEIFTGDSYSWVAYHEIQSDLFQKGSRVTIHENADADNYAENVRWRSADAPWKIRARNIRKNVFSNLKLLVRCQEGHPACK